MDTYGAKLGEVGLDFIVGQLSCEATNEDLAVSSLGFLWIDFLVVNNVISGRQNLSTDKGIRSLHNFTDVLTILLFSNFFTMEEAEICFNGIINLKP